MQIKKSITEISKSIMILQDPYLLIYLAGFKYLITWMDPAWLLSEAEVKDVM